MECEGVLVQVAIKTPMSKMLCGCGCVVPCRRGVALYWIPVVIFLRYMLLAQCIAVLICKVQCGQPSAVAMVADMMTATKVYIKNKIGISVSTAEEQPAVHLFRRKRRHSTRFNRLQRLHNTMSAPNLLHRQNLEEGCPRGERNSSGVDGFSGGWSPTPIPESHESHPRQQRRHSAARRGSSLNLPGGLRRLSLRGLLGNQTASEPEPESAREPDKTEGEGSGAGPKAASAARGRPRRARRLSQVVRKRATMVYLEEKSPKSNPLRRPPSSASNTAAFAIGGSRSVDSIGSRPDGSEEADPEQVRSQSTAPRTLSRRLSSFLMPSTFGASTDTTSIGLSGLHSMSITEESLEEDEEESSDSSESSMDEEEGKRNRRDEGTAPDFSERRNPVQLELPPLDLGSARHDSPYDTLETGSGGLGLGDEDEELEDTGITLVGHSMCIFGPESRFRGLAALMVNSSTFETGVLVLIGLSCVMLAMDGSVVQIQFNGIFETVDLVLTLLFSGEALARIVANGAFIGDDGYFKQTYNVIDFAVVLVSWITLTGGSAGSAVGGLRAARAMRALKPLRTIRHFPALRLSVETLMACLPVFANILLCVCFVLACFAIISVTMFAGLMWQCNDESVDAVEECIGNFTASDGTVVQRVWSNQIRNFDNFPNAMLTLAEVSTLENWLDVLESAQRAPTQMGNQPFSAYTATASHAFASTFFVLYVVIAHLLLLNLFGGGVYSRFKTLKVERQMGMMTQEQLEVRAMRWGGR